MCGATRCISLWGQGAQISRAAALTHMLTQQPFDLQGEDTDEVQNQPAWLRDDAQDEQAPMENGEPPSLANLSLHQRNVSTGAADFVGLGAAEEPYANGDSHAQPGRAHAVHRSCVAVVLHIDEAWMAALP